jgi:IPT/TIG domain-containing protein
MVTPNQKHLLSPFAHFAAAVNANDKLVDATCGPMIRALPSINMPSDLPSGMQPGLSPASGNVGTIVTISGTNFGTAQGTSTVTFNGVTATAISRWSATQIQVTAPNGGTGSVVVTVSGVPATGPVFTVQ